MSIYAIGDLHLSFKDPKPMNIFGENWEKHEEKIKLDWLSKVKENDTVILIGDFSWAMKLQDTLLDFQFINQLPGKKILLKGNHDYWWTTVTNMKKFLEENDIENVDFLHNNSFEIEKKIICGTRGWNLSENEEDNNLKMINREATRLKLSIEDGIQKYGNDLEKIAFLHYPPIIQSNISKNESTVFMQILKEYNIKRCYYGHLHGKSIKNAINGFYNEIELKLISSDGVNFKLEKITVME